MTNIKPGATVISTEHGTGRVLEVCYDKWHGVVNIRVKFKKCTEWVSLDEVEVQP